MQALLKSCPRLQSFTMKKGALDCSNGPHRHLEGCEPWPKILKALVSNVHVNRRLRIVEMGCQRGRKEKVDEIADTLVKLQHRQHLSFSFCGYRYI